MQSRCCCGSGYAFSHYTRASQESLAALRRPEESRVGNEWLCWATPASSLSWEILPSLRQEPKMLLEERQGCEGVQFFIPYRGTFETSRCSRGSLPQMLCMAHCIGLECQLPWPGNRAIPQFKCDKLWGMRQRKHNPVIIEHKFWLQRKNQFWRLSLSFLKQKVLQKQRQNTLLHKKLCKTTKKNSFKKSFFIFFRPIFVKIAPLSGKKKKKSNFLICFSIYYFHSGDLSE